MITKVEIQNFQSHKKTTVEFSAGVNVIIGPSDAGKSAIFNAINWVITNRPLGDSFRSEWGGETRVSLYTLEGNTIERVRTASKNMYILNGEELRAFGTEPPERVTEALKIDPANIQAQMDFPFLLSATPGEVARMLNKAASIDEIDYTVSGIKKSLTRLRNEILFDEKQLQKYEEQLQEYKNLSEIEKIIEKTEKMEEQKNRKIERGTALKEIIEHVKTVEKELQKKENLDVIFIKYCDVEKLHTFYIQKQTEAKTLQLRVEEIERISGKLKTFKNTEKADKALPVLERKFKTFQNTYTDLEKMEELINEIDEKQHKINFTKKQIIKLVSEYNSIAPETCPLCGNELKKVEV